MLLILLGTPSVNRDDMLAVIARAGSPLPQCVGSPLP